MSKTLNRIQCQHGILQARQLYQIQLALNVELSLLHARGVYGEEGGSDQILHERGHLRHR